MKSRRLVYRSVAATLSILCAVFLTACPKPKPALGPNLRRADQLLSEGKALEALAAYEGAKSEPPPGHAERGAGLCHELLGNRSAAVLALEAALKVMPEDPTTRLGLARLYAGEGKREQATTQATHVFEHHPDNLGAVLMLGALAQDADEVQRAVNRLEAWKNDPTQKRVAVVEWTIALWDLWTLKGDPQAAQRALAQLDGAPLGNRDSAILLSGVYVGLGRLHAAEHLLQAVTTRHPERLDAQRRLAYLATDLDHYQVAAKALATFKDDPTKLDETILRARVSVALGDAAAVIPELRDRILRGDLSGASPERKAQLRYWLGKALMRTGDATNAMTSFAEAIALWPTMVPAHLSLAEARLQQRDVAAAITGLETAVVALPEAADVHGLLGSAHMTAGDYTKAEAAFRKRAELAPKDAQGPHLVGVALMAQQRPDEARAEFQRALALDPAAVNSVDALASLLIADHKEEEAEALYQRAVNAAPSRIEAWTAFARFYLRVRNGTRAAAVIQQALKVAPDNLDALREAAQIAMTLGHHAEAEQWMQRLSVLEPRPVAALNNLAVLYDEYLNQPDKALETARKAHALAPDDANVRDTLGWILHRRGEHAEALTLLEASARDLPERAVVQFHYGMALLSTQATAAGKAQLKKALALDPKFNGSQQARAAL